MTSPDPDDIKLAETVRRIFDEQASFNRVLGLTVRSITPERVEMDLPMRDELVGNYVHGTLHGGVTSAALDATGGLAAFLSIIRKKREEGPCDPVEQFARLGTIDLRVDYLRPGLSDHFYTVGTILRTGRRVAVARTELHDADDALIALGTGAYVVD